MMVGLVKRQGENIIYGVAAKQFELVVTIGSVVWNALYVFTVRIHWRKMAELCAVHFFSPLQFSSDKPKSQAEILRIEAPGQKYYLLENSLMEGGRCISFSIANLFTLKSNRFYSWGYIVLFLLFLQHAKVFWWELWYSEDPSRFCCTQHPCHFAKPWITPPSTTEKELAKKYLGLEVFGRKENSAWMSLDFGMLLDKGKFIEWQAFTVEAKTGVSSFCDDVTSADHLCCTNCTILYIILLIESVQQLYSESRNFDSI